MNYFIDGISSDCRKVIRTSEESTMPQRLRKILTGEVTSEDIRNLQDLMDILDETKIEVMDSMELYRISDKVKVKTVKGDGKNYVEFAERKNV